MHFFFSNYGWLHFKYNNLNKDTKDITKVMRGLTVGFLMLRYSVV